MIRVYSDILRHFWPQDLLTFSLMEVPCLSVIVVPLSLQAVLGPLIAIALKISDIHERTGRRGPSVIT